MTSDLMSRKTEDMAGAAGDVRRVFQSCRNMSKLKSAADVKVLRAVRFFFFLVGSVLGVTPRWKASKANCISKNKTKTAV